MLDLGRAVRLCAAGPTHCSTCVHLRGAWNSRAFQTLSTSGNGRLPVGYRNGGSPWRRGSGSTRSSFGGLRWFLPPPTPRGFHRSFLLQAGLGLVAQAFPHSVPGKSPSTSASHPGSQPSRCPVLPTDSWSQSPMTWVRAPSRRNFPITCGVVAYDYATYLALY